MAGWKRKPHSICRAQADGWEGSLGGGAGLPVEIHNLGALLLLLLRLYCCSRSRLARAACTSALRNTV